MDATPKTPPTGIVPLAGGGSDRFRVLAKRLPRLLGALRSAPAIQRGSGSTLPETPGIYLLTENGEPAYVGQTRNLRRRLAEHGAGSARQNQATFAFNLAREQAEADPRVDLSRSREELAADPRFAAIFRRARERVASMSIRYVEVGDPELRTVLEV